MLLLVKSSVVLTPQSDCKNELSSFKFIHCEKASEAGGSEPSSDSHEHVTMNDPDDGLVFTASVFLSLQLTKIVF